MDKNKFIRLSKPILYVAALLALTIACAFIFCSLPNGAGAEMNVLAFEDDDNGAPSNDEYVSSDDESEEEEVTVEKETPAIDFSAILQKVYTYNGAEQHIIGATHNNTDEDVEVSYANNTFTDVPESGKLTITVTLSETANFKGVSDTCEVEIHKLNVILEVKNKEGIYGEEPSFAPEDVKVIAGKFVNDDIDGLKIMLEPKDSYPVGVCKLVASAGDNYNVTVAKGAYTILERPITVTLDDKQSQYGDDDVPLTYTVTEGSVVNNDVLKPVLVREEGNSLGEYAISGSVVNPNYKVTVVQGLYTITQRKISIVLYDQEGTKVSHVNKKGYKITGGVLRGDNLDIKVILEEECDGTPGEYALTATYADNPNYDITVLGAKFTLRYASRISVVNPLESKLYDGKPYVYDVAVSSGATPMFSVGGIYVENSFTEIGLYEISITAPVYGEYAEPDPYEFTLEIRPSELVSEQDDIKFTVSKEGGFAYNESLEVRKTQDLILSGKEYTKKIDSSYALYIVRGEESIALEEYMQGEEISVSIKLSERLQQKGVSTWFTDNDVNLLKEVDETDENGYIEVDIAGGNQILFIADRQEATPLLIAGAGLAFVFLLLFIFYLFRKKEL